MPDSSSELEQEAAIRQTIKAVESGWNEGSGERFAAPFAKDADYSPPNGMHDHGRANIEAGHERIFSTFYKGSKMRYDVETIRFIRSDVAIVHVRHTLQFKQQGEDREANTRSMWVLVKNDGEWQVAGFHNTMLAEPAGG